MTSFRRTRSAILQGTKDLISLGGLRNATMIEIADTAQVSRATLYNHFRDKDAVLRALMESEVERLFNSSLPITEIAWEISSHPALATLRRIDPGALTDLLARSQDELWLKVRAGLESVVASPKISTLSRTLFSCALIAIDSLPSLEISKQIDFL